MDTKIKWWNLSIGDQIANAGGELARAIRRKNNNDSRGTQEYCIHAIELLSYTKLDPKNANRYGELSNAQEEIMDYLFGENLYKNDDESIMKFYDAFIR